MHTRTTPIAAAALLALAAAAPAGEPLKNLHALLVIDTQSDLGTDLKRDQDRFTRVLKLVGVRPTVLSGPDVTAANVRDYYAKLEVGPDDGLLFYYAGHGATDPAKGPYFPLGFGPAADGSRKAREVFLRSELHAALRAKKAASVVILTDCCSDTVPIETVRAEGAEPKDAAPKTRDAGEAPVARNLLLGQRGVVDVTAATDAAAYSDDAGGAFTKSLCELLDAADPNAPGAAGGWKEFFPELRAKTEGSAAPLIARLRSAGVDVAKPGAQRPRALLLGGWPTGAAVLSLLNKTKKPVRFQFRWAGEADWAVGELPPMGRAFRVRRGVEPGSPCPAGEVKLEGFKGVLTLASKYCDRPEPAYEDGEEHRLFRSSDAAAP